MITLPLEKMTFKEKLLAMEALWQSISQHERLANHASPAWHADCLAETEASYLAGKEKVIDWAEAKKQLSKRL